MRVRGKPGGGALLSDSGLDAPSQITNLTDEETGNSGGFFGAWGSGGTASTVPHSDGGPIALAEHDIEDLKLVRTPVFVSCSVDTTCRSWNLREGVQRRVFRHRSLCTAAALSHPIVSRNAAKMRPIRPLVATCGAAGSLRLWDELTGTLLHKLKGHAVSQFVFSVAFWIDKEVLLVSGGADHSIKVWDCVSGEGVATFLGHRDLVTSVSVVEQYKGVGAAQGLGSREDAHHHPSAHAAIVSSSLDGTVRVWDLQKLVHMCFRSVLQCGCFDVDHSEGHRNAQMGYNPKHKFNRKPLPGNRSRPYAPFYPKVRGWNAHIHQAQAKVGFGMKPKEELNVLELEDRETWEEQQALKMYALEEDKWAETTVRETLENELPIGVEWEELAKNKFFRDKLEEAKEAEDFEMKDENRRINCADIWESTFLVK